MISNALHSYSTFRLRLESVFFTALDFDQAAKKIPHFTRGHKTIIVVGAVAGPDFFAAGDVSGGPEYDVGIFAELDQISPLCKRGAGGDLQRSRYSIPSDFISLKKYLFSSPSSLAAAARLPSVLRRAFVTSSLRAWFTPSR